MALVNADRQPFSPLTTAESAEDKLNGFLRAALLCLNHATIGHPGATAKAIGEAMRDPKPGDWVIEGSTIYGGRRHGNATGLGRLIGWRLETIDDSEPEEILRDTFAYIEGLDGGLQRWENCTWWRIGDLRREASGEATYIYSDAEVLLAKAAWAREAVRRHGLPDSDWYATEAGAYEARRLARARTA